MNRMYTKVLPIFLCIMIIFISSISVFAENTKMADPSDINSIKATVQKYFDSYYETLKTGSYVDVADLFIDNAESIIPQRVLKNHLLLYKEFGRSYTFYNLSLDYKNIQVNANTAKVEVVENVEYQYNTMPKDVISKLGNIKYTVELERVDNVWKISLMNSENNDYYEYVSEKLKSYIATNSEQSKRQNLNAIFDEKDNYTKSIKDSLVKSYGTTPEISVKSDTSGGVSIQSTYSYDFDKGVRYALTYAVDDSVPDSSKIFARCDPDCTNFVSQCIWAAYGAWDESSVTNSRNNVANKVRMTSTWYGSKFGYGAFTNAWAGVVYLYNYVTQSKSTGPSATGYGEATCSSFDLSNVGLGDVVQLYNPSYGNWRHSLYVTYAYHSGSTNIIAVCAHDNDEANKDLIEYLNDSQFSKARGLRFSSANF